MRAIIAAAGIIGPLQGPHGYLPPRLDGPTPQSHEYVLVQQLVLGVN